MRSVMADLYGFAPAGVLYMTSAIQGKKIARWWGFRKRGKPDQVRGMSEEDAKAIEEAPKRPLCLAGNNR